MTTTTLDIIPAHNSSPALLGPGWDHAIDLYTQARKSASNAVSHALDCGRVLRQLRDATVTLGGDRRSDTARSVSNVGQRSGFAGQLEQAGIPKSTAYDWIDQADMADQFLALASGETKKLRIEREIDGEIKEVDQPITDRERTLAAEHLRKIQAGETWPKRAWAGFRSGIVTVGSKRNAPDTFALIREALACLDRQLPALPTLSDDERLLLKKYVASKGLIERISALESLK